MSCNICLIAASTNTNKLTRMSWNWSLFLKLRKHCYVSSEPHTSLHMSTSPLYCPLPYDQSESDRIPYLLIRIRHFQVSQCQCAPLSSTLVGFLSYISTVITNPIVTDIHRSNAICAPQRYLEIAYGLYWSTSYVSSGRMTLKSDTYATYVVT